MHKRGLKKNNEDALHIDLEKNNLRKSQGNLKIILFQERGQHKPLVSQFKIQVKGGCDCGFSKSSC